MSAEGRRPGNRRLTLATEPPPKLAAQLVEQIREPILIVAAGEGSPATPVITYANSAAARLIGRAVDAVVGQPVHLLASTDPGPELARLIDATSGSVRSKSSCRSRMLPGVDCGPKSRAAPWAASSGHT